jgi:hypothetical protein
MIKQKNVLILIPYLCCTTLFLTGCIGGKIYPPNEKHTDPGTTKNHPEITDVELDRIRVPKYESIEMKLSVQAEYTNPYDAREVILDGTFQAPDGTEMKIPGFWDGVDTWRIRFSPSQEGEWQYQLYINDLNGSSPPFEGSFIVDPSDNHGWLQVGQWLDPEYSSKYLVHHDGTPFYGIGHCDALNILTDGFNIDDGVQLFNNMQEAGENFVVWWPFYSNSIINNSYDNYTVSNLNLIDIIVQDAQKKGIFLIFTVWDHPQLRDKDHSWGDGRWEGFNGFHKLSDIDSFFTSDKVWVWQENLYRYIIARWGYSPAIGMWQTVSEINGTNAYDQTNLWHEKINTFFVENDPYRHLTTASKSGDEDWPEGHQTMDSPQVHIYSFGENQQKDVVKAAEIVADWTELMWKTGKPNWIGEFGVPGNTHYPELFHNAIWAALGAGAAMTPAEWNSGGSWMQMTPEMYADIGRLSLFIEGIPLAKWNPSALQVNSSDPKVRGWGVGGENGGLFWVQDFSFEGKSIEEIRLEETTREGVRVEIFGLQGGTYTISPYDTWKGNFLEDTEVECFIGQPCSISLPAFKSDMAFKFKRK